jgi:hypothetical protein
LFLAIVFTAVGQQVRCKRVGKQAAAVVDLAAFGGLLAKFASVIAFWALMRASDQ